MGLFSHPYPLGLPKGSVRAILAIASFVLLGIALFYDVGENGLAVVAGLAGSTTTYYFTKRGDDDRQEAAG
jgi:hypothetical protein